MGIPTTDGFLDGDDSENRVAKFFPPTVHRARSMCIASHIRRG
jgi:hypothetical protein